MEYEDAAFNKRKASKPDHLGLLGPVLKGEVGDEFIVSDEMLSSGNVIVSDRKILAPCRQILLAQSGNPLALEIS